MYTSALDSRFSAENVANFPNCSHMNLGWNCSLLCVGVLNIKAKSPCYVLLNSAGLASSVLELTHHAILECYRALLEQLHPANLERRCQPDGSVGHQRLWYMPVNALISGRTRPMHRL